MLIAGEAQCAIQYPFPGRIMSVPRGGVKANTNSALNIFNTQHSSSYFRLQKCVPLHAKPPNHWGHPKPSDQTSCRYNLHFKLIVKGHQFLLFILFCHCTQPSPNSPVVHFLRDQVELFQREAPCSTMRGSTVKDFQPFPPTWKEAKEQKKTKTKSYQRGSERSTRKPLVLFLTV